MKMGSNRYVAPQSGATRLSRRYVKRYVTPQSGVTRLIILVNG